MLSKRSECCGNCFDSAGTWRERFDWTARCTATSKRTRLPCQAPAVTGWTVCRLHGARGGGPKGERNGGYRHGLHTAEAVAERRTVSVAAGGGDGGEGGEADAIGDVVVDRFHATA